MIFIVKSKKQREYLWQDDKKAKYDKKLKIQRNIRDVFRTLSNI